MKCLLLLLLCAWQIIVPVSTQDAISEVFLTKINQLMMESNYQGNSENIVNHKSGIPKSALLGPHYKQNRENVLFDRPKSEAAPPIVRVERGLLFGATNADSHAFYSVPYAQPPIGPKRYMPPEPLSDHTDLNVSVPDYRSCWQVLSCEPNCTMRDGLLTEDCLLATIDIPKIIDLSDPDLPPSDLLPVMVWIHGGFYLFGSGTEYETDARRLSRDANVVVVRVNYRLGPLGFISFQDGDQFIEGNQGLMDQRMALQWVQDNIEKFGGDKNKITIFGNSAGAQSVMFHLLSSSSDPLFHRAIMQSNPAVFPYQTPQEFNNSITRQFLDVLSCNQDTSCLRYLDPKNLTSSRGRLMLQSLLENDLFGAIEPFRPVIDGEEFKAQPLTLFKKGLWQTEKEIIIGTTKEEMSYIEAIFATLPLIPLPEELFKWLNNWALGEENGMIMSEYYSKDHDGTPVDYSDNFAKEVTDLFFVCPNRALARYASETTKHPSNNVFLFNLAYPLSKESCNIANEFPPVCGYAYHSSEIVMLFKSDHAYGFNFTEEDNKIADMMSSYWGSFAHNGNPSDPLSTEFTEWPIYSHSSNWQDLALDYPQSVIESDYKKEACDLWDSTNFYFEDETSTPNPSDSTPHATSDANEQTAPSTTIEKTVASTTIEKTVASTTIEQTTTSSTLGVTLPPQEATTSGAMKHSWHLLTYAVCLLIIGLKW